MIRKALIFIGIIFMGLGILVFIERGFFARAFLGAIILGDIPWDRPDAIKMGKVIVTAAGFFIFGIVLTLFGILHREPRRIDFTK